MSEVFKRKALIYEVYSVFVRLFIISGFLIGCSRHFADVHKCGTYLPICTLLYIKGKMNFFSATLLAKRCAESGVKYDHPSNWTNAQRVMSMFSCLLF